MKTTLRAIKEAEDNRNFRTTEAYGSPQSGLGRSLNLSLFQIRPHMSITDNALFCFFLLKTLAPPLLPLCLSPLLLSPMSRVTPKRRALIIVLLGQGHSTRQYRHQGLASASLVWQVRSALSLFDNHHRPLVARICWTSTTNATSFV